MNQTFVFHFMTSFKLVEFPSVHLLKLFYALFVIFVIRVARYLEVIRQVHPAHSFGHKLLG